MSDSEVITIAICMHLCGQKEQPMLRCVAQYWQQYFPRLLCQSSFNRRSRDLAGVFVHMVSLVAKQLQSELSAYQVFDGVPIPLAKCCRGERHRLFSDEASIGKGGSDHDWYYGCQLLPAVTTDGVITGFVVGPASTEGHWLAEHLLCWRTDSSAQPWCTTGKGWR